MQDSTSRYLRTIARHEELLLGSDSETQILDLHCTPQHLNLKPQLGIHSLPRSNWSPPRVREVDRRPHRPFEHPPSPVPSGPSSVSARKLSNLGRRSMPSSPGTFFQRSARAFLFAVHAVAHRLPSRTWSRTLSRTISRTFYR